MTTRREFLRLAGGALVAAGTACNSGSDGPQGAAATAPTRPGPRTLRIAQWNNYVGGYDAWWDNEYTRRWGERNGIDVTVDHFDINQTTVHAENEVASQRGHDLFHMIFSSPAAFEDEVIDHREIIEEVQAKLGRITPFVERTIRNSKTNKFFAFSDYWSPNPVHYRTDLWAATGRRPDSWDDVLAAGARLKAQGHPIGLGLSDSSESNITLLGLMHAFGGSIQDEQATVTINSAGTVEAVKACTGLFRSAMPDEVLNWDITSNNRFLVSGRGSLILNAIAAIRALEIQDPGLAAKVELLPAPAGPAGRASPYVVSMYVIWKFAENQEAAKQFLVDLALAYREPFFQSQFLQIPSFPAAVPDLAVVVANDPRSQPAGKCQLLAGAADWTTNLGHPGHTNAAVDEVIKRSIISEMFAAAAKGEMSPEEAVKAADAKIRPIYDSWRERGKI